MTRCAALAVALATPVVLALLGAEIGARTSQTNQTNQTARANANTPIGTLKNTKQSLTIQAQTELSNADQFRNDFAQFVSKCEQQLNQILQEAAKASGQHLQAIQSATGSAI